MVGRNFMKSRFAFLLGNFLLVLSLPQALAAVPLASPEQDRYAKQAVPPTGKALIYVYRLEDASPQTAPGLWLNKRESGRIEPRTYGMWAAGPGRLEVRAGRIDATPLAFNCEAGRIYFIQLTVSEDGSASLRQVSYGTGRTEMAQARLVLDPAIAARAAAAPRPTTPPPAPAQQTAATPAASQAPEPRGDSGITLILKLGSFQLANASQQIVVPGLSGSTRNFSSAGMAYGLEGEWRMVNGFAFGMEVFGYSQDWTTTGFAESGSMAVTNVFFNAKKYFRPGATVQPYLGAGIGAASTNFGGDITGSAGGAAFQGMAGVAFRWQKVGVYTEFKFESAKVEDAAGVAVNVSGTGLFAGVSVYF
jgi:hypothetical protein